MSNRVLVDGELMCWYRDDLCQQIITITGFRWTNQSQSADCWPNYIYDIW